MPPNWQVDKDRLASFLEISPRELRCAFEFRNPSWDTKQIYDLLARYNAGYCIFDLAGYRSPTEVTAKFTYVRLHGPGGKYQGTYKDGELGKWARQIEKWRKTLSAIYVYFDNDDSGYAPRDGLRLKSMIG